MYAGVGAGGRCATPCFDNLSMSMSVAFHGDLCSYTYTRVNRKVLRQMKVFDFSFFFHQVFSSLKNIQLKTKEI